MEQNSCASKMPHFVRTRIIGLGSVKTSTPIRSLRVFETPGRAPPSRIPEARVHEWFVGGRCRKETSNEPTKASVKFGGDV